jgi:hypothetical protein
MRFIRHVSRKVGTVGTSTITRKDPTSNLGLEMIAVARAQTNTRKRSAGRFLSVPSLSTVINQAGRHRWE